MRYQCLNESCKKVFMHPAKHTTTSTHNTMATVVTEAMESSQCPHCYSLDYTEFVEPQPEIVSIKSVPIEDADALIGQGYVVLEAFAKSVTLVKKEAKP